MGTYHLNPEIENRLKAWARSRPVTAENIKLGGYSFSDVISDLLKEVGF